MVCKVVTKITIQTKKGPFCYSKSSFTLHCSCLTFPPICLKGDTHGACPNTCSAHTLFCVSLVASWEHHSLSGYATVLSSCIIFPQKQQFICQIDIFRLYINWWVLQLETDTILRDMVDALHLKKPERLREELQANILCIMVFHLHSLQRLYHSHDTVWLDLTRASLWVNISALSSLNSESET